ncbi:hypothetical protein [Mycolicibacterium llatzerense]|uniref:hypothetical protein n=1 Tax=Mycolicibacterium llatzerense TaxID=280871 RepID=UPI0021B6632C|nr:hypothetical protein [Mycolicibacterium llatzerense]MCT7361261.1 hypothetical protein [Mycolicibacterium llatzerense]
MTDQSWSDDRWREHNRMLREVGGVCVMPDQWKQINKLANEICATDVTQVDAAILASAPRAVELAWSLLNQCRREWTMTYCGGTMTEYCNDGGRDFATPPEFAIDDSLFPWHDRDLPTQLYAVSPKFQSAFALSDTAQWILIADKAMEINGCDGMSWSCDNPCAKPSERYAVKFGEFISVVTVCDSCAAKFRHIAPEH